MFDLDGEDGAGWQWRQRWWGEAGRAGRPGHSAGSFFGAGSRFQDGGNLRVTARGGRGGMGEDREDGMPGAAGRSSGGSGGSGGDGGMGGLGGRTGIVKVLAVGEGQAGVQVEVRDGGRGSPGVGGRGGYPVQVFRRKKRELLTFLPAAAAGGMASTRRPSPDQVGLRLHLPHPVQSTSTAPAERTVPPPTGLRGPKPMTLTGSPSCPPTSTTCSSNSETQPRAQWFGNFWHTSTL